MPKEVLQKIDHTKDLTEDQKNYLIKKIPLLFKDWDDSRSGQLSDAETLKNLIFADVTNEIVYGKQVVINTLYELWDTLIAHIKENVVPSYQAMFDVEGTDIESEKSANIQKNQLIKNLKDMDFEKQADLIVRSLCETGDMIAFVQWETVTEQVRRKKEDDEKLEDAVIEVLTGEKPEKFAVEEEVIFEGASVKAIRTEDFVFDVTRDFDKALKICRGYATLEELLEDNQNNLIDDEVKQDLIKLNNSIIEGEHTKNDQPNEDPLYQEGVKDDMFEVLDCYGDIRLKDGRLLRNYTIAIAGRKHIIKLMPNPYVLNPLIYLNVIEHPDYKRGMSPLIPAVIPTVISSDILNKQLDTFELVKDPPWLAPEEVLEDDVKLEPGLVVKYKSNLGQNEKPTTIDVSKGLRGFEFLDIFKQFAEAGTGQLRYLNGNSDGTIRTATETNALVSAQNQRIGQKINKISKYFVIAAIEKIAKLNSFYKFGNEEMYIKGDSGSIEAVQINDAIRQGKYTYTYSDKKVSQERKSRFKELIDYIGLFGKLAPQVVDMKEIFQYGLEQLDIENTERFLSKDKLDQILSQFPVEEQEIIREQIAGILPGLLQQIMGAENGQDITQGGGGQPTQPQPGL